ncbi:DUF4136 domain-containing protein [Pseudomonas sp. ZM23]|uniref:DUF4136 domain-containing protein n=1 Tax=Pseudomonas triclosanedens TaxID=2961893 RepID=A0ABY7A0P0_9PSED|nr:DUF4136 domain-containing protein [Pseudomonas triclosanedens]MCP8463916.1 DUF4136 domain-containing protein [Pseudomonas triclosanedens]MCP8469000.1 DUF4136 domain-containing protein [Pseudomonas triclosanedens]MCP8475722.1 DUF4136 domain-containing protein [Pseudomonas triclosanedens]WAI50566.1 DUF4136 domain-containing protein [Pseudomonas triclosanedens]
MSRLTSPLFLSALFLLLAGCASDPDNISVSPNADGHQSTFFIQAVRALGHREDLEGRFDLAVRRALEAKGYRFQDRSGELRVIYAVGLDTQTSVIQRPVSTEAGVVTQTQIADSEQARVALRIIDEASGEVLFQALVARHLHDPSLNQQAFDEGIARLLKDFPPRAGR